jgi:photosystem II stability/assembly factor-like uncharacterized protein
MRLQQYSLVLFLVCVLATRGYGVWNLVLQLPPGVEAGCGYFFDADHGMIGTGYRDVSTYAPKIYLTSDGGKTWKMTVTPDETDEAITNIMMVSPTVGYASIFSNNVGIHDIWKTVDGGNTWTVHGGIDEVSQSPCIYATSKTLIATSWFAGGISVNDGLRFSTIFSEPGNNFKSNGIDFTDDNNGSVTMGPSSGFTTTLPSWFTHDGGKTWNQGGSLPEAWGVYGVKGTKLFFAMPEGSGGGFPNRSLFRSTDGGATWNVFYNFSGHSFTGHIAGVGNTIYVQTTDLGLYRSLDLGVSWTNVGGPPHGRDTRFVVTGCQGEVVYAFDGGGGVWKTTDGGDGAFGLIPRLGNIAGVKAGDTALIPIYFDSTGAPFTISQFSGSLLLNTELLTPFGFDTMHTLSSAMIFDSLFIGSDKSINFITKYSKPLKNGIPLSTPIIYIKAAAYLTKTDTTTVKLSTLNINSGASLTPLIVCNSSSSLFTLVNECGDSSLRGFMNGEIPKLLSIRPNPLVSGNAEAEIYLPAESDLSLDIYGTYNNHISNNSFGHFGKGIQKLIIPAAGLPSGDYFLKMKTDKGSYLTAKMVITR